MRIRKLASTILGAASLFPISSSPPPQIPSLWTPNSDAAPPCELNRSSWDATCPNLQQMEMKIESEGNPVNGTECEGKIVHSHLPSNGEDKYTVDKKPNAKLKGRKGGGVANVNAKMYRKKKKSSGKKRRKAVPENGAVPAGGQGNYIFYYNGFGPCRRKRRGGGNEPAKVEEEDKSREISQLIGDPHVLMINNDDAFEDWDGDRRDNNNTDREKDHNLSCEKRRRKQIKARSLKSLL